MKFYTITETKKTENEFHKLSEESLPTIVYITPSLKAAQKEMERLGNEFGRNEDCQGMGSDMDLFRWITDHEKREFHSAEWKITECELPVPSTEVCVEVKGGMVQNVFAKGLFPLKVEVLDMDITPSGDNAESEEKQLDGQREEIERIKESPEWNAVW